LPGMPTGVALRPPSPPSPRGGEGTSPVLSHPPPPARAARPLFPNPPPPRPSMALMKIAARFSLYAGSDSTMPSTRHLLGGLLGLVLCVAPLRADKPPPLRLLPADADLVIQPRGPRPLPEAGTTTHYVKKLLALDGIKELLDGTQTRRFYQMVAYFERELGVSWPELLDRVGGGGAALAAKLGDNAPALFVLQGTDEKMLRKFTQLLLNVV